MTFNIYHNITSPEFTINQPADVVFEINHLVVPTGDFVESVTSTDNHIVVDNTDHKNPSLSFQLVDNENLLTDNQLALVESAVQPEDLPNFGDIVTHNANEFAVSNHNHSLANLTEKSYNSLTDKPNLSVYQTATDNDLQTTSKDVVGAINEVNNIALGSQQAVAFNDYIDLVAFLNAVQSGELEPVNYNIGQSIYLLELEIPDLWVTFQGSGQQYTYISDERFIEDILAGAYIGNYQLGLLETGKVDLTDYYTKTEIDQNFANETQDSIGELIEKTELETIGDTTKFAVSDSAFLKWISSLRIYNYIKGKFDLVFQPLLTFSTDIEADKASTTKVSAIKTFYDWAVGKFATITDYFTKTDSDRRYVAQNGGTIHHITRWFTPTSALTIAANGLSATITSGQFTSAMTGAKLRLTGGINEPIITYVSANSITLSFAVDSSFWGRNDIGVADWGVYGIRVDINGFIKSNGSREIIETIYSDDSGKFSLSGYDTAMLLRDTFAFLFSSTGSYNGTKDLGFKRNSASILEINNGTAGTERDVALRKLYQQIDGGTSTGDAVGDRRISNIAGVEIKEICTVANATKGGGTWKKNSAINEFGGQMIALTNKTGANSVKGTVVSISDTTDNAFRVNTIDGDMPIGVVYESGIADGSECWVVVSGIAEVLLVNSVASTRSYIAYSSATVAGRIDTAASAPAATVHFREIGHTLESKTAGTNVLCKCVLHFN